MLIIDCHGHYTTVRTRISSSATSSSRAEGSEPAGAVAGAHQRRRDPRDHREEPAQAQRGADITLFSCAPRRWRITSATKRRRRPGREPATISSSASWICIPRTSSACASCRNRRAPIANSVAELKRCVTELGFVGCNLNPDPSGGTGNRRRSPTSTGIRSTSRWSRSTCRR